MDKTVKANWPYVLRRKGYDDLLCFDVIQAVPYNLRHLYTIQLMVTYYEPPFVAMIDSGTFWRCPHGETRFGDGCRSCAIAKPLTYLRTRFKRL